MSFNLKIVYSSSLSLRKRVYSCEDFSFLQNELFDVVYSSEDFCFPQMGRGYLDYLIPDKSYQIRRQLHHNVKH